jgi:DNA repair photolyase
MQLALFDMATQPAVTSALPRVRIQHREKASVFSVGKGRTSGYDFSLNPYVGCSFGCQYCYAQFFVADAELRSDWGHWVEVKSQAVREVERKSLGRKRVYMSSATDPYQPIESRLQLTRTILEAMSPFFRQPKLVIQTRSPLVTRDIDLLKKFRNLRVNFSVTTDSDSVRKEFEPNCPSIERRLDAAHELKSAGIAVGICVSPMLPIEDPIRFAKKIEAIRPDAVAAAGFHEGGGEFRASTPDWVLEKASSMGWTRESQRQALDAMTTVIPEFRIRSANAFAPV